MSVLGATSCTKETFNEMKERRANRFLAIIPADSQQDFFEKREEAFLAFVREKKATDPAWLKNYEKIKDEEAINLFSDREVYIYFRTYLIPDENGIYDEKSRF